MAKTKSPLVSVIIPIYNIEDYLSTCLESVISQSYTNLEILAVIDGATDSSLKIAKSYAKKDKRIRVLEKPNGGQSDARNYGCAKCKGDYITFLDGDDYLSKYFVQTLIEAIQAEKSNIAVCDYKLSYTTNNKPTDTKPSSTTVTYDTEEALKKLFYQKGVTTSPWAKLYKKELFHGIEYPVGKKYEDLATTYKVFAKANKITLCDAKLYYYSQRENSTMNSSFKPERLDGLHFAKEALIFAEKNYPRLEKAAINRIFIEAIYIFEEMPKNKYKREAEEVWSTIKKYRATVKNDHESKSNVRNYAKVSYLGKGALRAALKAKARIGEKTRKQEAVTHESSLNELDLNGIKLKLTETLRAFNDICAKNGIKYSLIGGSLIGAVRHHGIIPWDDDVDIIMHIEEYEKLKAVMRKMSSEQYELFSSENRSDYYYPFAKFVAKDTLLVEYKQKKIQDYGIYLDIFTYYPISNRKDEQEKFYKKIRQIHEGIYTANSKHSSWPRNPKYRIKYIKHNLKFWKNYTKAYNEMYSKQLGLSSDYMISNWPSYSLEKEVMRKEWLNEYITMDFEGIKAMVFKDYDKILSTTFGDYMKLPPKEKRITHHSYKAYLKEVKNDG